MLHIKDKVNNTNSAIESVTAYLEKEAMGGYTALFHAAAEGNVMSVRSLLAAKANALAKDDKGWTPMHFAAANGHTSIITVLFQHDKSTLEQRDNEGRTPLQRGCYYGHKAAAQLLLSYKADIESCDDKGKTPLHAAVSHAGIYNEDIIRLLISKGAKLEANTDFGWTPLHSASRYGNEETVELLISLGADTEAKNHYGETPLNFIVAEEKMHHEDKATMINALLRGGANIHTQDNTGRTPLHWACVFGHLTIVAILIKHNAVLDAVDKKGKTPLHYAAESDHQQVIEYLIDRKKHQALSANIKSFTSIPTSAKPTGSSIFTSAVSQKDNAAPNKFVPAQNNEYTGVDNKIPSPNIKKEAEQDDAAEFGQAHKLESIIQKQQAQIDALCRLVQLQSISMKQMEGGQKKLQAELDEVNREMQMMRQELDQLKTKPQQIAPPRATFFG